MSGARGRRAGCLQCRLRPRGCAVVQRVSPLSGGGGAGTGAVRRPQGAERGRRTASLPPPSSGRTPPTRVAGQGPSLWHGPARVSGFPPPKQRPEEMESQEATPQERGLEEETPPG